MEKNILTVVQIAAAILLIVSILIQAKGTGLGSAWGGSGESYRSKRGVEKVLYFATIVFATIFLLSSVAISFIL